MAILRPIVEVATDLLTVAVSNLFHRRAIRAKLIRYDYLRGPIPLHGFPKEPKCRLLITGFRNKTFQHLTFMIDSPPEIVPNTIDLHEDLIQVPLPLGMLAHV